MIDNAVHCLVEDVHLAFDELLHFGGLADALFGVVFHVLFHILNKPAQIERILPLLRLRNNLLPSILEQILVVDLSLGLIHVVQIIVVLAQEVDQLLVVRLVVLVAPDPGPDVVVEHLHGLVLAVLRGQ